MSGTPVSWFLIEEGWSVVSSDGVDVGTVHRVAGDQNLDIFDGLAISASALSSPVYVPAEQVGEISDGRVTLLIPQAQVDRLEPHREPPASEEILPESSSLTQRIAGWFRGPRG
jgi:hypothetical protein